jgi:lipopolysaccharide transport system permease protein
MLNKIRTYEPDNCLKKGYLSIFKEIINEIIDNKWLIYQLFKRDFSSMYRESFFGILWILIIPFVSVAGFFLLGKSNIVNIGPMSVSFPIYAISGLSVWQLFSVGMIAGTNSLVRAGSMVVKINFSKKSLIISAYAQSLFPFFVLLIVSLALALSSGVRLTLTALLFPLLIIPIILFTLGLGFLFALINGILRDVGNAISVVVTFIMLLTPILYTAPEIGAFRAVVKYNPLYYMISIPRDVILTGRLDHVYGYFIATAVAVVVFVISLVVFHITEARIAERI